MVKAKKLDQVLLCGVASCGGEGNAPAFITLLGALNREENDKWETSVLDF